MRVCNLLQSQQTAPLAREEAYPKAPGKSIAKKNVPARFRNHLEKARIVRFLFFPAGTLDGGKHKVYYDNAMKETQ